MLDDWRTAPIGDRLRATLGLLETLTLRPEQLTPDDIRPVREAGVSNQAVVDAIHVCALFNTIDRIADGLGFDVPTSAQFRRVAPFMLKRGYRLPAFLAR